MFSRTLKAHKLKINTQMRQQASHELRVAESQWGEGASSDVAMAKAASSLIRNEDIYMAKTI